MSNQQGETQMKLRNACTAVALSIVLGACASSSILVGTPRPPIDPSLVRIYVDPPAVFEKVALLEASSRNSWAITSQQKTNKALERLKEEAAALGANGILFQGMGSEYAGNVGSGAAWGNGNSAWGIGSSAAVFNKAGAGIAIYVPPESAAAKSPAQPAAATPAAPAAPAAAGAPCESCGQIGKGF